MNLKQLFISFSLIILNGILFSQEKEIPKEIIIRGVISADSTGDRVSFAKIINHRSMGFKLAGIDGDYHIKVRPNDTIVITSVGYEAARVIIDSSVLNALTAETIFNVPVVDLNIQLKQSAWQLPEFTVWSLTKDEFKYKFIHMKLKDRLEVELVPISKASIAQANPQDGFGYKVNGPITAIYERFGKKGRQKSKIEKYRNIIVKYRGMVNDTVPYFNTEEFYETNKKSLEKTELEKESTNK